MSIRGAWILFAVCLLLALPTITQAATSDSYISVFLDDQATPGGRLQVTGDVFVSGESQNSSAVAVFLFGNGSALVASNSSNTAANGKYNVTLTMPTYEDNMTLVVDSAASGIANQSFPVKNDYFGSANFSFVGTIPPFSPGDTFTVKTTASYTNSTPIGSQPVTLQIFQTNGVNLSWGGPTTNTTQSNGEVLHSFTIPSTASPGDYLISAGTYDGGVAALFFEVKTYVVSATAVTVLGEPAVTFAPASHVVLNVKTQDTNGTAITGATVLATIKWPNGTIANSTTVPASSQSGLYNVTLKNTSLQTEGKYSIEVSAVIGSTSETTSADFTVSAVTMNLDASDFGGFFQEFGGKQAVYPGSNMSLDLKAYDVSTGKVIQGKLNSTNLPINAKTMNCTSVTIINVTNAATGAAVPQINTSSIGVFASQKYSGKNICTIEIITTGTAGTYQLTVNASVNATGTYKQYQTSGFFTTQNYVMQVSPVSAFGSEEKFAVSKPGSNMTFKVDISNLSASGALLTAGNISSLTVVSLTPMGEFSFGSSQTLTNVSYWNLSSDNSTNLTNNGKLIINIPTSASGPTLISLKATVAGQALSGSAFVMATYLMGFVGPVGGGFGGQGGGDGGVGGGPSGDFGGGFTYCADATKNLSMFAKVFDVETFQAKSGVVVKMSTIKEEFTGKDVTSCFNSGSNITDSNGQANFQMQIVNSSCASSLSGFLFGLFDAKYQNVSSKVPGGWQCKSLNFWPQINPFQVGKTTNVSISVSNVKYLQNASKSITNGTVTLKSLIAFDPDKGPTTIDVSNIGASTFTIASGTATFNISPSNITDLINNNNATWYNGFYNALVQVCGNANDSTAIVCDTSFSGWKVAAFQAYAVGNIFAQTYSINDSKSFGIYSDESITTMNISWFTFKNGQKTKIANLVCSGTYNASAPACLQYNQSVGSSQGPFNHTVNFTVPTTLSVGAGIFEIKVTGVSGEATTVDVFADLKGLVSGVIVPGGVHVSELFQGGMSTVPAYFAYPIAGLHPSQFQVPATSTTLNVSRWFQTPHDLNDTFLFAWNLTAVNASTNGTSNVIVGPSTLGYCVFTNPFNTSIQVLVVPNASDGSWDSNMMFFKQNSSIGNIGNFSGPLTVGKNFTSGFTNANASRYYFTGYEFCDPTFVAASQFDYVNALGQGQSFQKWSTSFSFLGRVKNNKFFYVPFVGVSGSTGVSDMVLNIQNVVKIADDKQGLSGSLAQNSWKQVAATSGADGLAMVAVNISPSGIYKLFWNSSKGGITGQAGFDEAPFVEVASFNAFAQMLGGGSTTFGQKVVSKYEPVMIQVNASYFNGTSIPSGANANISISYLDFSSNFGPPTSGTFNITNSSGSAVTVINITSGGAIFNVTPPSGWPTNSFGVCVDIMGSVNAGYIKDDSGQFLGSANFFASKACTVPVG